MFVSWLVGQSVTLWTSASKLKRSSDRERNLHRRRQGRGVSGGGVRKEDRETTRGHGTKTF